MSDWDNNTFGQRDAAGGAPTVPHYHGDAVRALFIAAALLCAVAIPIWGDLLPYGTFAQVAMIILLVVLAGLTNPHGKAVMIANAVVAALGALFLEAAAIVNYHAQPIETFLARETAALMLLAALYYSVRTIRATAQHKIGKHVDVGEFDDDK